VHFFFIKIRQPAQADRGKRTNPPYEREDRDLMAVGSNFPLTKNNHILADMERERLIVSVLNWRILTLQDPGRAHSITFYAPARREDSDGRLLNSSALWAAGR
jgi:hypothetical protein